MAESQVNPTAREAKKPAKRLFFRRERNPEVSRLGALLSQAVASQNGTAASTVSEALSVFSRLNPGEKEAQLKAVNAHLRSSSKRYFGRSKPSFIWSAPGPADFGQKAHATATLSSFLAGAAALLPRQGTGLIITRIHRNIHSTLIRIAQSGYTTDARHAEARNASTAALWELEYAKGQFWLARLEDPATRAQTIAHFLAMEGDPASPTHGWSALSERMPSLWMDIASSPSPAVPQFLLHCIGRFHGSEDAAVHAFRAACYLPAIPIPLATVARTIVAQGQNKDGAVSADLWQAASDFLFVYEARHMLSSAGGEGAAFAGAFSLVMLHNAGRGWLRPMLDNLCRQAETAAAQVDGDDRRRVLNVISALGLGGIKAPQDISCQDGRVSLPPEIGDIAWDISGGLPVLSSEQAAGTAPDEYKAVRSAVLRVFDRLSGEKCKAPLAPEELARVVPELITLRNYCSEGSAGRRAFDSALAGMGARMVDTVVSLNPEPKTRNNAREAAQGIITVLKNGGIAIPYGEFLDSSIAFTSDSAEPIPKSLADAAVTLGPVNCALAAAIYLPQMPREMLAFAAEHIASEDARTRAYAKDFIFIHEARGMLAGDARFAGAFALGLLYKAGRHELNHLVNGVIADSVRGSAQEGEPGSVSRSILSTFHGLGITEVSGIKIRPPAYQIPDEVLQAAVNSSPAECVLAAGVYLDPMPAQLIAFAEHASDNGASGSVKTQAWELLLIHEALGRLDLGSNGQFRGVYDLIGLYNGGRRDLGFLLFHAGAELADVIMSPAPGAENQRQEAWAALEAIEKAGVDLTYHRLHAAPYLDSMPAEITSFAESILAQPEPAESIAAAARDLLAIKEVKDLLARDPSAQFVCAHALSSLVHTGSGNVRDMLVAIGASHVAALAGADNPTRQKAMRVLGSLADLDIPGDALFAAALGPEPDPTLLSSAAAIANGKYPDSVRLAAQDFITLHGARRKFADPAQQFEGVDGIVDLYLAGRPELAGIMDAEAGPAMAARFLSAESREERGAAAEALGRIYDARPEAVRSTLERAGADMRAALSRQNGSMAAAAHGICLLHAISGDFAPVLKGAGTEMLDAFARPRGRRAEQRAAAQKSAAEVLAAAYPLMEDEIAGRLERDADDMVNQLRAPWTGSPRQEAAAAWLAGIAGIAGASLSEASRMDDLLHAVGAEMIDIVTKPAGGAGMADRQRAAEAALASIYPVAQRQLQPMMREAHKRLAERVELTEGAGQEWECAVAAVAAFARIGGPSFAVAAEELFRGQVREAAFANAGSSTESKKAAAARLAAMEKAFAGVMPAERMAEMKAEKLAGITG